MAGFWGRVVKAQPEKLDLYTSLNNRKLPVSLLLPCPHWVCESRGADGGEQAGALAGTHFSLHPRARKQRTKTPTGPGGLCCVCGARTGGPGGAGMPKLGPARPMGAPPRASVAVDLAGPRPCPSPCCTTHPLGCPLGPMLAVSISQTVGSSLHLWYSRTKHSSLSSLPKTVFIHFFTVFFKKKRVQVRQHPMRKGWLQQGEAQEDLPTRGPMSKAALGAGTGHTATPLAQGDGTCVT